MQLNFDIKLTKKQQEAYNLLHEKDTQYLVARWSRQCGKTVFSEICIIESLFKNRTFNAYISPTYSQGRKVYKELITLLEPTGIIKKANSSTLTIETIYNSTFQAFSMDSPNSIRGYTVDGILVMDECAFYPDELTDGSEPWSSIIMPITKARKPKVLAISTPKGKRGFWYDMYLKAVSGEKGFKEISATIYEDDLITKEQIEDIKRTVSPLAFQEEFLVEYLDSSITFFKGYEHCFTDYIFKDKEKIWCGVDLSSTGEDATVVTLINESMQVKQYVVEGNLDIKYTRIANILNNIPNLTAVYLENNGVGAPMIHQIKKLVNHKSKLYDWTTTNSSKEEIVSNLAVKIANREIHFNNEDGGLYSELGRFVVKYTKLGHMQFEGASGSHDDKVLSLCIALRCYQDFKFSGQPKMNFVLTKQKLLY